MNSDAAILGTLAADDDVQAIRDGEPVFINTQGSLQFLVTPISDTPDSLTDVTLYTGYSSSLEHFGFIDNFTSSFDRVSYLYAFMNDRLFIFRPQKRGIHYHISNAYLVKKPDGFEEKIKYTSFPVFSQKKHGYSFEEFKERIQNNKILGKVDFYVEDLTPEWIFWEKEETSEGRSFYIIGPFESHVYRYGGLRLKYTQVPKVINFEFQWFDNLIEVPKNDTLVFIGEDVCAEIRPTLPNGNNLFDLNSACSEVDRENEISECAAEIRPDISSDNLEQEFISYFIEKAKEQGFLYDEQDLINFHTAMKSSNLVILAGMSGTGKTRLVDFYRIALGIGERQTAFIPVRPSWTDDSDLIGFVDLMHMVYRPGDSGLINTLVEAAKERDKMYLICFDEMNLARVEHYFSQFLSVLELETSKRKLRLYNDELEPRLYNAREYPPSIMIGENVLFVGTVNIDESTYHFSDKVLDRANVISLNVLPFDKLKALMETKKKPDKGDTDAKEWSFEEYRSFKRTESVMELSNRELSFLKDVHCALQSTGKNMGIGFRIIRQIDSYMKNLPKESVLTREVAFDLQVVQRILTKIRGSEDQLKSLLGTIKSDTGEILNSIILDIVNQYTDVSPFESTRKITTHKVKELKMYGFTL